MKLFFPLFLISISAFGQTKLNPVQSPTNKKFQIAGLKLSRGFYLNASGGESWGSKMVSNRTDETVSPTLGPITYQRTSEQTLAGVGTIETGLGYSFGNNLSVELTYLYKANSSGNESTSGTLFHAGGSIAFKGTTQVDGKINKHCVLTTLFYDVPFNSRWIPFIGAGLGLAIVNTTDMHYNYDVTYSNGSRVIGNRTEPGGNGNAVAYQAKLGLTYLASKKTAVFFTGDYLRINKVNIEGGTIYKGMDVFGVKAGLLFRITKNPWLSN
jgi:opacity protein-like surface antigen